MKRSSLVLSLVVIGAATVGCAAQWQVVAQAAPDPFVGQHKFGVLPIDYAGARVGEKSEAEYLAGKDEKQRASFTEDKAALNDKFAGALMSKAKGDGIDVVPATGPGSAPFMLKPTITFIEPGFYVGVASAPSKVEMTVKITTPDGKVLDEILMTHSTDSRSGFSIGGISLNPSSGGRLRDDGEALGKILAKYLQARVGGA